MGDKVVAEITKLDPDSIIELIEVDLTIIKDLDGNVGSLYRFHDGTDFENNDLVWAINTYQPFPYRVTGFEITNKGEIPRPALQISNIGGLFSSLIINFRDILGAKVTRIRTFVKYLDAVNYPEDTNPTADPTVEFPREVYYINRKVNENARVIEFELASKWDLNKVMLPRRLILQNTCMWEYEGVECTWDSATELKYFTKNDISTGDPAKDQCGKRLKSCIKRFGATAVLPYGGFPGVGQIR